MTASKVWQLQLRKGADVLWFEQSDSEDHRDVERAGEHARNWLLKGDLTGDDFVLFWTEDPSEFVQADRGVTP